ncbi:hypothetical protein [Roseinatronobacter alkalisoli]|uniref:Uncharacterized protein n=1 Tax=Roseinatronobacter alkalisoli TaxID=3028235 RepID=A0ABT5T4Z3_9RHOB|nr:hypothetical protein [Roseinatronobacter sp. HJB301]MDD7970054.1 hypothetical protein [Roseinatronobacter sp. HJB301]
MTHDIAILPKRLPGRAVPQALLAVYDGITNDAVRARLTSMQRDLSMAPPHIRVFRH